MTACFLVHILFITFHRYNGRKQLQKYELVKIKTFLKWVDIFLEMWYNNSGEIIPRIKLKERVSNEHKFNNGF